MKKLKFEQAIKKQEAERLLFFTKCDVTYWWLHFLEEL